MNEDYAYNIPRFFDFGPLNGENAEFLFFESPSSPQSEADLSEDEISDPESDALYFTPREAPTDPEIHASGRYARPKLRKSLSLNNLLDSTLKKKDESLEKSLDELNVKLSPARFLKPNKKLVSQEHINRLAQPKRFTYSADNLNEHMTLAEAVKKYQAGIPERFRSRPTSPKINKVAPKPWGGTKGHTPNLTTKHRARPVTAISFEEKEKLAMEEAKKFKIRAHPVNKHILKGQAKPIHAEKKPATATEPFHLTEVKKKEVPVEKVPVFKARPVPKSLHNFKVPAASVPMAKPPSLSKRQQSKPEKRDLGECAGKPKGTKPQPFSFEKRDLELLKKKECRISQVLEEERKAREFHARPPPKNILKPRNVNLIEPGETKSFKSSSEALEVVSFKAKRATVLTIPPFKPRRDEARVLEVEAFRFSTDDRIEARRKLQEAIREKEAMVAEMARRKEESDKKREEEEIAKLRKEAEYRAQPIRKYKGITIQLAHKATVPKSPAFHSGTRNKENIKK